MGRLVLRIGDEDLVLKVKNVNGVGFHDRLSRARYDTNIYLSLIVEEPKLSATEWYERVPEIYKEKIIQAIERYLDEHCVQPL